MVWGWVGGDGNSEVFMFPLDASPGAPMTSGAMMNVLFVGELLLVSVEKPE